MATKKQERIQAELALLAKDIAMSLKDIADRLGVSEITVRRDMEVLQQISMVKLINGVAVYVPVAEGAAYTPVSEAYDIKRERGENSEQKQRIGRFAASLVKPGDVIAIDAGSTTETITSFLSPDMPLSVLCYSTATLLALSEYAQCQVICAGGYLKNNTLMFQSPEGISLITRTSVNKAFISANGVDIKLNVSCIDPFEIQMKGAVMSSSIDNILMADSTKFDKIYPGAFARLSDFSAIITDSDLSPAWQERISELGIQLYVV